MCPPPPPPPPPSFLSEDSWSEGKGLGLVVLPPLDILLLLSDQVRSGHKVLSSLNCLSTMVVRAGIVTGDTLWEPSLASWFLAIKSEEGNKATFSHWPRLDTLFATQAWISLRHLPEAKASKKAVLRVRCLRSVSKGVFVSSLRTTERFYFGRFLEHLGRSL